MRMSRAIVAIQVAPISWQLMGRTRKEGSMNNYKCFGLCLIHAMDTR